MNSKEIVVIQPKEDSVFMQLDDDLFFNTISKQDLEPYVGLESLVPLDTLVGSAIARALNIQLPERLR